MENQLPMSELVKRTKAAYGMTWQEMGEQLGRSERMVRKIANGESPGENYRTSLTELYEKGQVITLTPRRRTKKGKLVPIRAKRESGKSAVIPKATGGKRQPTAKQGKYAFNDQHLPGGNRRYNIEMPKTKNSKGRNQGLQAFDHATLQITKSQAQADKRMRILITVQDENGNRRRYEVGSKSGFHASDVRTDIKHEHGGSIEGWLKHQLNAVYPGTGTSPVVGVEINAYNATRTKDIRRQEDTAGTRRRRWSR